MNATLQCLLHVSELVEYFLKEFPNDFKSLCQKNNQVPSKGNISMAFYHLIQGVYPKHDEKSPYNTKTFGSGNNTPVSPDKFQKILGFYNPQFKNFEANDSKDLILYLLQTMHAELNYLGDASPNLYRPNQYDRVNTFQYFIYSYDMTNFSIISKIFYGTYENMTKCLECKKDLYNFQKFEFISFSMFDYKGKDFNIYNGFEDNQKMSLLVGDNQFYCNNCKKLCDAELYTKIIFPPNKLLINIDYGKNKKFSPLSVKFDEEIDITKYVNFNFGFPIKYRIIGICSHFGSSGSYGHYVAFCKHPSGRWFFFNDSSVNECSKNNIYSGSPYLLLYEKINYS
jgi:ubiquitin C-terminal hydrolase